MDTESPDHFRKRLDSVLRSNPDRQGEFLNEFREFLKQIAQTQVNADLNAKLSASDIVQSVIIDAQKSLPNCAAANREQFKAWLKQIMLNDIVNRFRYLRRQKRNFQLEQALPDEIECDATNPADSAQRNEHEHRLNRAIAKLPEDHQKVLFLRHRENHTFSEIGEMMHRSPDAVRMLWNRAISKLAKELKLENE